jgi:predicted HTH transcriptional regulator
MSPQRTTVVIALQLAARRRGVTAPELAERTGCSPRTATYNLSKLAADGVLERTVPTRKGKALGDWRIVYRMARTR